MHISTGDILREEMKNKTPLGKKIKQFVENGDLVPDEMITRIIKRKFAADKRLKEGWMLDGFPRTEKQAKDLDGILKKINAAIDYTIYMEASLPVIVKRLTGRMVCRECGALFHRINKRPQKEGTCDECGGSLYQRADDKEGTIKTRMEVYLKNTAPIINYYEKQGKLTRVNADKDAEYVERFLINKFHENGKLNKNKIP